MGALTRFFELRTGTTQLTLEQQKKAWLGEFLKTYAVLIVVYGGLRVFVLYRFLNLWAGNSDWYLRDWLCAQDCHGGG